MSKHRTSENGLTLTLAAVELLKRIEIANCSIVIAKKIFNPEIIINLEYCKKNIRI